MTAFHSKTADFIKEHSLLARGDNLLACVSGGMDSMALLHWLNANRAMFGLAKLAVAHLDHSIRGADAERDADFAGNYAAKLGLIFHRRKIDVPKLAADSKTSLENAGRMARYAFFNELSAEYGYNKIATAHHAGDQAETVLLRMLRGAGPAGAGGIRPLRDGKIIRPLLAVSRAEIEEYVSSNGIEYVTDATNQDISFPRNRVRLSLIPLLEREYNPSVVHALARFAELTLESADFTQQYAEDFISKTGIGPEKPVAIELLNSLHPAARSAVLASMAHAACGGVNISREHIMSVVHIVKKGRDQAQAVLPGGIRAVISGGKLVFFHHAGVAPFSSFPAGIEDRKLVYPGELVFPELGRSLKLSLAPRGSIVADTLKNSMAMDPALLPVEAVVRTRRPGDIFTPFGHGSQRKLKSYLIDMKIPRQERDSLLLIASGNNIYWVEGLCVSEKVKISAGTNTALVIESV